VSATPAQRVEREDRAALFRERLQDPGPIPYGGSIQPFPDPQRVPSLPRSICVEAGRHSLTVGELRQLLQQLPDEVEIRADSLPVKVAAHYGRLLLLDTCTGLPAECTGCGQHGCDGRCQ